MRPAPLLITRLIRAFTTIPVGRAGAYSLLQRAVGGDRLWRRLVAEGLQPKPGDTILDVGCGPADLLSQLPEGLSYTGIEPHRPYLEAARRRHGVRGRFLGHGVEDLAQDELFTRIVLCGTLHHLDEDVARRVLQACAARLHPEGWLVVLEPCPRPGRSLLEDQLYAIDRGGHLRSAQELESLLGEHFKERQTEIWEGVLRLPYTHLLLRCRVPGKGKVGDSPDR